MEACFEWGSSVTGFKRRNAMFWWNNGKICLARVPWRPLSPSPHPSMGDCKSRWLECFLVGFCSLEAADKIVTAAQTQSKRKCQVRECCPWMGAWHDAESPGPRRGLPQAAGPFPDLGNLFYCRDFRSSLMTLCFCVASNGRSRHTLLCVQT